MRLSDRCGPPYASGVIIGISIGRDWGGWGFEWYRGACGSGLAKSTGHVLSASPNTLLRFCLPFGILPFRIRPALLVTRRKHCAVALPCGADLSRDPFAGLPVEGFLAFVPDAYLPCALDWKHKPNVGASS